MNISLSGCQESRQNEFLDGFGVILESFWGHFRLFSDILDISGNQIFDSKCSLMSEDHIFKI